MRTILSLYVIAMALLVLAKFKDYTWIAILALMSIFLGLAYGFYVVVQIFRITKKHKGYSPFNTGFYVLELVLLFVIALLVAIDILHNPATLEKDAIGTM